jgi:hypothetical protein
VMIQSAEDEIILLARTRAMIQSAEDEIIVERRHHCK